MMNHGFRKFFETNAFRAGMNREYIRRLLGQKGGSNILEDAYLKLSEEELLEGDSKHVGYIGIIDQLTIDETHKLKLEVQTLKQEKSIEEDIRREMLEKMDAINELQQENQDLQGQVGNTNKHLNEILKRMTDLDRMVHQSVNNASSLDEEVKRVRSRLPK
jgi:FtsZ-binding cell division protein ZapB